MACFDTGQSRQFCGDVRPINWAHSSQQRRQIITLLANSRQKVGPNIPRYASKEASYPAHQQGSCVDLVTVHEDSAFVLRVFGRVDNERLSYATAVIFGLRAR